MLRQVSRNLVTRGAASLSRRGTNRLFSTDLPATETTDSAFIEAWKKVIPNIEPPKTPLSFMKSRPPTPATIPSKLTVNFVLPDHSELSGKEVNRFSVHFESWGFFDFVEVLIFIESYVIWI